MAWSPDQEEALKRITEWLRSGEPRFSLGGYAGTGKTTLARYIAEEHGGRVKFAAFTGQSSIRSASQRLPRCNDDPPTHLPAQGQVGRVGDSGAARLHRAGAAQEGT